MTPQYKSPLHSLIATGPIPSRVAWQESIINHLTQNCSTTNHAETSPFTFPSPLPDNLVPKPSLEKTLHKVEHGETPLNLAVRMHAPSAIVAALCKLCSHAASIPDSMGALPLHRAAERPTGGIISQTSTSPGAEAHKTLGILVETFSSALIKRDQQGRTPLHCLLGNYAESRNVSTVELLCRSVEEKVWIHQIEKDELKRLDFEDEESGFQIPIPTIIKQPPSNLSPRSAAVSTTSPPNSPTSTTYFTPASALIIPDAIHGFIPLHYAAVKGASKEVLKYLVKMYPASVIRVDKMKRTPLHWYLGAGKGHIASRAETQDKDEEIPPLHHTRLSSNVISILLHHDSSSKYQVGSMRDINEKGQPNRTPLHWAVELVVKSMVDPPISLEETFNTTGNLKDKNHSRNGENSVQKCLSMKALQLLIDSDKISLVMKDSLGHTPLHTLFNTAHEWNENAYKQILHLIHTGFSGTSIPVKPTGFSPPIILIKLLLQKVNKDDLRRVGEFGEIQVSANLSGVKTKLQYAENKENGEITENDNVKDNEHAGENIKLQDHDEKEDANESFVECAAMAEDLKGMLPLHYAAMVVTPSNVTKLLLDCHPTSLIHTTSDADEESSENFEIAQGDVERVIEHVSSFAGGRTPLHMAFASPYVARLHTKDTIQHFLHFGVDLNASSSVNTDDENEKMIEEGEQNSEAEKDVNNENSNTEMLKSPVVMVDGTIVLRMEDADGKNPLHLAAEHHADLEVMRSLLDSYPAGAYGKTESGDLPLHLLLDKKHVFVNVELALAQGATEQKSTTLSTGNPFTITDNQEHRGKLKELAKKQTTVMRMTQFDLGGAIFAPTEGWISDEEETERQNKRKDLLEKVNLLVRPLIHHEESLNSPSSVHGLLPLHVAVAFHAAPYKDIHRMLQEAPESAQSRSLEGYSALDLHNMRKKIPGEIALEEYEAWYAIRELLFSYEMYPLMLASSLSKKSSFYQYRTNGELIDRCVQAIMVESRGDLENSVHMNPPVDPVHELLGFSERSGSTDKDLISKDLTELGNDVTGKRKSKKLELSDVVSRLWVFLTTFTNPSDPSDHYAVYIEKVVHGLHFQTVHDLVNRAVPDYGTHCEEINRDVSKVTIRDCANVYCKSVIHSFYYFAGLYEFIPPSPDPNDRYAGCGPSILLHYGRERKTMLLRATEHSFKTESSRRKKEKKAKLSTCKESDGLAPSKKYDTNFTVSTRLVCIKFISDRSVYEREIKMRSALDIKVDVDATGPIVPILANYDATCSEKASNRQYASDILDERFQKVPLRSYSNTDTIKDWVDISSYPYAIVLPLSTDKNLEEVFSHEGVADIDDVRETALQIGGALKFMHKKNIIHGSLSMHHMISFPAKNDWNRKWKLTDLAASLSTCRVQNEFNLGCIEPDKNNSFDFSLFPPEMFKKLDAAELKLYEEYWERVNEITNSRIPSEQIEPYIDPENGEAYILKCSCQLNSEMESLLPVLPYDLVKPSESIDIWSFGVVLFKLCSGGTTLFQTNMRTRHLSFYKSIAKWDIDTAESLIYKHIKDIIAQDLLLHILVPSKEREDLDMATLLSHPFFTKPEDLPSGLRMYLQDMKDKRKEESELRKKEVEEQKLREKEDEWVKNRTLTVNRLTIDSQMKMLYSTSELIKEVYNCRESVPVVPYCHIILPYKLVRNKSGKLTPATKRDVEFAERIGKQVLYLSKVCCFVSTMEKLLASNKKQSIKTVEEWAKKANQNSMKAGEEILLDLNLNAVEFMDLASRLVSMISLGTDQFLSDPLNVARKLVRECTSAMISIFADSKKSFFYLVDEFRGVPVSTAEKDTCYPHVITEHIEEVVLRSLPFMHMCILHMRGAAGGVSGLVKLIFEGAYPHTPPSWAVAARGLDHSLNHSKMVSEVKILLRVINEMSGNNAFDGSEDGAEELHDMKIFLEYVDVNRDFAGLKRVTDGKVSLWTTDEGFHEIEKEGAVDFLNKIYNEKKGLESKMKAKDLRIVELEKALKELSTKARK